MSQYPMRLILALIVGVAPGSALLAQAPPTPITLDGKYVGTATLTASHSVNCPNKVAMEMTVGAGRVSIRAQFGAVFDGTVDGSGRVSAQNYNTSFQRPFVDTIVGTIANNRFTANESAGQFCDFSLEMTRQ